MDINQNAPVIAHEQIHIAADVQTVWDVLSDIEQWPSWNKAVRSMSVHGPVAPARRSTGRRDRGPSSRASPKWMRRTGSSGRA